ncbi:hypothetical protein FBULB1_8258 [Fusarium bulbicola]|nr:hypothetical protein FBULB1_8258 [Fusarium bulbicola]
MGASRPPAPTQNRSLHHLLTGSRVFTEPHFLATYPVLQFLARFLCRNSPRPITYRNVTAIVSRREPYKAHFIFRGIESKTVAKTNSPKS